MTTPVDTYCNRPFVRPLLFRPQENGLCVLVAIQSVSQAINYSHTTYTVLLLEGEAAATAKKQKKKTFGRLKEKTQKKDLRCAKCQKLRVCAKKEGIFFLFLRFLLTGSQEEVATVQ